jgi:hypothetical protein
MTTFSDEYILMRSEQLVGTALMVVVKASLPIRNVEYADKKTGLQGLSGNKGGVGIRFDVFDSSVCLMTCHLAAGQTNYTDRNADYRTISHGLVFPRGKTIDSHEYVKTTRHLLTRQHHHLGRRLQLPRRHGQRDGAQLHCNGPARCPLCDGPARHGAR